MTEEEAKTKWCPMTFNADVTDRCIGSDCMMWREEETSNEDTESCPHCKGNRKPDCQICYGKGYKIKVTVIKGGRCGLGGKP